MIRGRAERQAGEEADGRVQGRRVRELYRRGKTWDERKRIIVIVKKMKEQKRK